MHPEIGYFPEDWHVATLGEIGQFRTGPFGTLLRAAEYYSTEGAPLVSVGDINDGRLTLGDHTPLVPFAVVNRLPQYLLQAGDLVFSRKGGVDKTALVSEDQAGCFLGSDGICWRPHSECNSEYAKYQLQHPAIKAWLLKNATGTTMPSMNQEIMKRLRFALPDLPEQRAIAEALSDADGLIEALEKLIVKKQAIKQAAMQQLLTGKTRLPGFKGKWETKQIAEIARPSTEKNTAKDDLPVLVCSKHLGFVDSLAFFKNQVFSKDLSGYRVIRRGQMGYPANHIEEGSIGLQDLYDVAIVSPIYVVFSVHDSVDSFFLHRMLKLDRYQQVFASATSSSVDRRGSLRWPEFSKIPVSLPLIDEQHAIAAVLSDMDTEISALEQRREKSRQIKHGMMQQLLSGRIRLVTPEASKVQTGAQLKARKPHSWAFNEAIVISTLTKHFGKEEFPLGRKRYTKLSYLLHRRAERQAEGYLKKAAGPYNPKTKYGGPERIALESRYIREHKKGPYTGFVAADNIAQAEGYFDKWYGPDAIQWLNQFRFSKNDDLELLATVDMAAEELRAEGQAVDVDAVKAVIRNHPEWKAKLDRTVFSDRGIAQAINDSQKLFGQAAEVAL